MDGFVQLLYAEINYDFEAANARRFSELCMQDTTMLSTLWESESESDSKLVQLSTIGTQVAFVMKNWQFMAAWPEAGS